MRAIGKDETVWFGLRRKTGCGGVLVIRKIIFQRIWQEHELGSNVLGNVVKHRLSVVPRTFGCAVPGPHPEVTSCPRVYAWTDNALLVTQC